MCLDNGSLPCRTGRLHVLDQDDRQDDGTEVPSLAMKPKFHLLMAEPEFCRVETEVSMLIQG